MRILLTGGVGQLQQELLEKLPASGDLITPGIDKLDLAQPESIQETLEEIQPDLIVNPAAYTAVDRAETERELAFALNAEAPRQMALWARKRGTPIIHYSTDYLFDGSGSRPWEENDPPKPINVYGESKLAGENAIRELAPYHVILRTSWLYSPVGSNFLLTMLKLGREREELCLVSDQIGAPTSAETVAEGTMHVLRSDLFPKIRGTYHLTCSGETSWYGFAEAIFAEAQKRGWPLTVQTVTPILSEAYPTPARRPLNSRLSTERFVETFGWSPPEWSQALRETLDRTERPSA